MTQYQRVLLKLSGEVFGGGQVGVDPDVVSKIAHDVAEVVHSGVQVAVVTGGGNFFRGAELQQRGMDRVRADYMGMLGIVMNCLAPRRAIRHMEKGRVVIFGAGMGMPFFSTDTVAVQRALESKCDAVFFAKSGVDGVYSADPRKDPSATKYDHITFDEAISKGLAVVDQTAFTLCAENELPMVVFGMEPEGNIPRVLKGERIGTLVEAG